VVDEGKRLPAVFFRTETGSEPVRDWLKDLSVHDKRSIGEDIMAVEFGWPLGLPFCRSLKGGLWEVRSNIRNGIARVLFCIHEDQMVLLHGFVKKAQKTPKADLDLAKQRKRDLERHRQ
jgi:phage-related protein